MTINKTASEVYEALKNAAMCKITVNYSATVTLTIYCSICAVETNSNGEKSYSFYIYTDKKYTNSSLSASDTVVVTEE